MRAFEYCPHCSHMLTANQEGFLACPCGFVHWDNPVPVVACVVPMEHHWLERAGIATSGFRSGGLLLVQRDRMPFAGDWCLPCGFMDKNGHPKGEATKEVLEETGIAVRLEKMLCACNPMPGEVNQIVLSYLARPVGGVLMAGSDARAVGVFDQSNAPKICFRSHQMLWDQWFLGNLGQLTGQDLLI